MLNSVTVKQAYPILQMNAFLDSLEEVHIFSTIDASFGYWQIEIVHQGQDKTIFTSQHELDRFLRKCFGLKNAPNTFRRATEVVL